MTARAEDVYGSGGSVPDAKMESFALPQAGFRANAVEFGAQVGQAMEQAGAKGVDLSKQYLERAQHLAANDLLQNSYIPEVNKQLADFKKLNGADASIQLPDYQARLKNINEKYRTMGSPYQQQLVGDFMTHHELYALDQMSNHADSEYEKHGNLVYIQTVKNYEDNAADNYKNPDYIDQAAHGAGETTYNYLKNFGHMGSDPEAETAKQQLAKEARSKVIKSAIDNAIATNDVSSAKTLLARFNDDLSGHGRVEAEKKVTDLDVRVGAKDYVDSLTHTGLPPKGESNVRDMKARGVELSIKNGLDPQIGMALWGTESSYKEDNALQVMPQYREKGKESNSLEDSFYNGAKIWNANNQELTKHIGRMPNAYEGYVAYNQGGAGAAALFNAPTGMTAVDALSRIMTVSDARNHVVMNGGTLSMSASAFTYQLMDRFSTHYHANQMADVPNLAEKIKSSNGYQVAALQPTNNPHDLYEQYNRLMPEWERIIQDNIQDIPKRDAALNDLHARYKQAQQDNKEWVGTISDKVSKYGTDPEYTSIEQIPISDLNEIATAGKTSALKKMFKDKTEEQVNQGYGSGFLSVLNQVAGNAGQKIEDLSGLQDVYAKTDDVHSAGFNTLSSLIKKANTPEGVARIESQAKFLNQLYYRMTGFNKTDMSDGMADSNDVRKFTELLPLFFSQYGKAEMEGKLNDFLSLDAGKSSSFVSAMELPEKEQLLLKKAIGNQKYLSSLSDRYIAQAAAGGSKEARTMLQTNTPSELQ